MQIFLQTCMGVPAATRSPATRRCAACGSKPGQAWPDTCKDFPAAWTLCHDFACSHVACKFSCRRAAPCAWTPPRAGRAARIQGQDRGFSKVRVSASFSKFRLLASLKFWVAKFRRVVSASSARLKFRQVSASFGKSRQNLDRQVSASFGARRDFCAAHTWS